MVRTRIEVQHGNAELTFSDVMVTIGGRTGVDILLRDVMIADRHCVITYEDGFLVRDTGSVTGTWVDGVRASPAAPLSNGATIVIGTTKITAAVNEEDGAQVLRLSAEPESFWWKKAGKGAFDNDPDQLVYSETKFGRFPTLRLGNRIAVIAGAVTLLGATFVSSIMEPLADAGPLSPAHAMVTTLAIDNPAIHSGITKCVELSGSQGCNVCHTTGAGTPEKKCAQCHGLEGGMANMSSWRHPYLTDGEVADQQFCVKCHTDHNAANWLKPISSELLGNCAACHDEGDGNFNRASLIASAGKLELPAQQQQAFDPLNFPHDRHLAQGFDCAVCHETDKSVLSNKEQGIPDNPSRHDFRTVPYEVCASCHVAESPAVNMTPDQQQEWRPNDFQWNVKWHGTDDGGKHCMQCHNERTVGNKRVFGPEMRTVDRAILSAQQYREQRSFYRATTKSHSEQFEAHQDGKECTECHLAGQIELPSSQERPARPFWHGLHMAQGALTPATPIDQSSISLNSTSGCVSCHDDLGRISATGLTPLAHGGYHWPDDETAQVACKECHIEGGQQLTLQHVAREITVGAQPVVDFPHSLHVGAASFGKSGSLEGGCFACHTFSESSSDDSFIQVPRVLATAANCTDCHAGHNEIAGSDCQKCHESAAGQSNSFLVQAQQLTQPMPTRPWPAANLFSHLSPGHDLARNKDMTCQSCHEGETLGLTNAATLGDIRIPDESQALCRNCHLQKQFHWR